MDPAVEARLLRKGAGGLGWEWVRKPSCLGGPGAWERRGRHPTSWASPAPLGGAPRHQAQCRMPRGLSQPCWGVPGAGGGGWASAG